MRNDKPTKMKVFAVVESMNYRKNGTEKFYHLVFSKIGAGWGNNQGERYSAKNVFFSKELLIKSLL